MTFPRFRGHRVKPQASCLERGRGVVAGDVLEAEENLDWLKNLVGRVGVEPTAR